MIILRLLAGLTGLGISEGMKRADIRRKADIINARYYENKRKQDERYREMRERQKQRHAEYIEQCKRNGWPYEE